MEHSGISFKKLWQQLMNMQATETHEQMPAVFFWYSPFGKYNDSIIFNLWTWTFGDELLD